MANAIIVNFKNSVPTPTTSEFFQVLFGYFLQNLNLWVDEYDKVYIIDSNWNFSATEKNAIAEATHDKGIILPSNPNSPYMTAFKEALPMIKEDKVLLLHDDTVIHKKGFVKNIFDNLEKYDIVSAFEKIGTLIELCNKKWPVLKGYSNFATALFGFKLNSLQPFDAFEDEASYQYPVGTRIEELDYTTIEGDWVETLGRFAIRALGRGDQVKEIMQDKSNLFYQTSPAVEKNSNTEWHHLRYGIVPARMLTNKHYGWPVQYKEEIESPQKLENLRKFAWYWIANENPYFRIDEKYIWEVLEEYKVDKESWFDYLNKFIKFHSLEVF